MMRREVVIFLIVGSLTVILDFLTYRLLIWTAWLNVDMAKGCGFIAGTVFAYFVNRCWTFGHKQHAPGSALRFVFLYALTLLVNVGMNTVGLSILKNNVLAVQFAFLAATGASAVLNFVGMKWVVFRSMSKDVAL